jgi:kanamycin kinase/aminoglycoside 3'-phosphotransferase-2
VSDGEAIVSAIERLRAPLLITQAFPVTIGESTAATYKVLRSDDTVGYLKISTAHERPLRQEADRTAWMHATGLAAPVIAYGDAGELEYLLTAEIPGVMACDPLFADRPDVVLRTLAEALQKLHSLDITSCPFDERFARKLDRARRNVENGSVDESDFNENRLGRTAMDLFEEMLGRIPAAEDLVVTHGDFCLPNIILSEDGRQFRGLIDLGFAGVADRYQDLALCARSIGVAWGSEWVPLFFECYGLERPEVSKLDLYDFLDEFF